MSIKIIADVHIGNHSRFGGEKSCGLNRRCRETLGVLEKAVSSLDYHDRLHVAGDLLDSAKPDPRIIYATREVLKRHHCIEYSRILVGNHEQSSTEDFDHSLALLDDHNDYSPSVVSQAQTIGNAAAGASIAFYPFSPSTAPSDMLRGHGKHHATIAIAHFGIEDSETAPYLRSSGTIRFDALHDVAQECGLSAIVCGDWHAHKLWRFDDCEIVQVGALVPTGFNNPSTIEQLAPENDPYGSIISYEERRPTGRRITREVIPGPRFVKTRSSADVARAYEAAMEFGHTLYLEVESSDFDKMGPFLESHLGKSGEKGCYYSMVGDRKSDRKKNHSAAKAAKNSATVSGALMEYVQNLPLPNGIDAAKVYQIAAQCVKEAGKDAN